MVDRDTIIKGCENWIKYHKGEDLTLEFNAVEELLAVLKEQDDLGAELTNAVELIHKKNERIKELLKEQEERIKKLEEANAYLENEMFNSQ